MAWRRGKRIYLSNIIDAEKKNNKGNVVNNIYKKEKIESTLLSENLTTRSCCIWELTAFPEDLFCSVNRTHVYTCTNKIIFDKADMSDKI